MSNIITHVFFYYKRLCLSFMASQTSQFAPPCARAVCARAARRGRRVGRAVALGRCAPSVGWRGVGGARREIVEHVVDVVVEAGEGAARECRDRERARRASS